MDDTMNSNRDTVTVFIDDQKISVTEGSTVLAAASAAGIYIPHLCYHPDLSTFGGCRVCMVDIGGELVTACRVPVEDGMVVLTDSAAIAELRRILIELILINHDPDCQSCQRNNDCVLQRVSAFVGITPERLARLKRYDYDAGEATATAATAATDTVDTSNPFFIIDRTRCILCGICIRTCNEINGVTAIDFTGRGKVSKVGTLGGKWLAESVCESCGECVTRCPTGALSYTKSEIPARKVRTICPYCGTGCGIYIGVRGDRIVSVEGDRGSPVNKGQLCVKGRFGYGFLNHPDRLTTPLIKRDGVFEETSWDDALDLIADKFKEIQARYGPEALAGLASARVTNEDNYLFQKFLRSLKTNSVDCCARLCHAPTVVGMSTVLGSGAMTNTVDEVKDAGAILVTGSNPTENHPVIGYRIREAVRKGSKLIVADPRSIPLTKIADLHLQQKSGTDIALFNGLMHVIIKEGLEDKEFIKTRTQGFEYVKEFVEEYTPEYTSGITGVPAEDIIRAARLFAGADSAAILYCMGITQHTCGTENVCALTNLSLVTGNLGKPSAGMNPLRGQNNVQGACDMGCLPNVLTGYQPLHSDRDTGTYWRRLTMEGDIETETEMETGSEFEIDTDTSEIIAESIEFERPVYKGMSVSDEIRAKFSDAWGVELSDVQGRTIADMFHHQPDRRPRAMYIMGEDPVISDPEADHVRKCLEEMEFVVVQDLFLTETAKYADVLLPAASFAEKDGTFINTARRVQRVRQVIKPRGESRPDWEIIRELSKRWDSLNLSLSWNYRSAEEIWEEVRRLTPHYFGGMSYARLEAEGGLQWPCPTIDHPGTQIMHKGKFARGIGQFSTVDYRPLATEATDSEYPFILTTVRKLYHYHNRSMTGRVDGLNQLLNEELMEINPQNAEALGLSPEDTVKVTSRRGSIETKIKITARVPPGVVSMSFHFAETRANILTNPAVCNMSVASGVKAAAVRVEKK